MVRYVADLVQSGLNKVRSGGVLARFSYTLVRCKDTLVRNFCFS